jgi:pseudouridine synthase
MRTANPRSIAAVKRSKPQAGLSKPPIRLAKLLAQRGVAARRKAEEMIAAGEVAVNGQIVPVVTFVDPEKDVVTVRGKALPPAPALRYYLLNKPAGYVTSRSAQTGRQSVLDLCKELPVRVEPVGRLDYETSGALLLMNDGALAHRLTHPSRRVPKTYVARISGVPGRSAILNLERGVDLEDGRTAPARVRLLGPDSEGNSRLQLTVTEGRNRLVRRMLLKVGHPVQSLRRTEFAGIPLGRLRVGEVRELSAAEVQHLKQLASP